MNIELAPFKYAKEMTWDEARLYCFSLNINGKVGWRLPTMKELHWLGSNGFISQVETECGIKRRIPRYWSSESHQEYMDVAWVGMPMIGDVHTTWDSKSRTTTFARPVRDL